MIKHFKEHEEHLNRKDSQYIYILHVHLKNFNTGNVSLYFHTFRTKIFYFYVFQRPGLYNGQSQRIGREKQTARGNI